MPEECVVCGSKFVAYVRDVPTIGYYEHLPLYYCMECESFTNPSGFIPSKETDKTELDFHIKVHERNLARSDALLSEISKHYPDLRSIVEIGCGTGTFIKAAQDSGLEAIGYDINEQAIAYGIEHYQANLSSEWWSADVQATPFDMLFCIMVLEHLEQPRDLFSQMASAAKKFEAKVFVSVPTLNRNRWHYILNPNPSRDGTPFFNNKAHVTHFSNLGLQKLGTQFGATVKEVISQVSENEAGWRGFVYDFSESPQEI